MDLDPDATLRRIRGLVAEAHTLDDPLGPDELVELVEALDEWITRGGSLPAAWRLVWETRAQHHD